MELVEIVLQGLAGFPQSARVQLGPGLTAVTPSNLQQFDTVTDVVLDLLAPNALENPVLGLVVTSADASRSGIHVKGRDGADYRVLKDVRAGRATLMRQQGEAMAPLTQDANEICKELTARVGFPSVDVTKRVFVLRARDLPSRNKIVQRAPAESTSPDQRTPSFADQPLPPGFSQEGAAPAYGHLSDDDKRARLSEIKGQIEQGQKIRDLEFKLDGMQKRAFEIEEKARPIAKLRQEVEDARRGLERFSSTPDVPSDFRAQVDRALKVKQAQANELAELERSQTALEEAHAIRAKEKPGLPAQVLAALDDKLVKIGLGSGLLAIAIAAVGGTLGVKPLQWVALLDIPAFFVALLGGMRAITAEETKDQARIKLVRVQKDKERLKAKAQLDATAFDALLSRYGLSTRQMDDVDQALEQVEHKRALTVKLDGATERLTAALADAGIQDIEARLAEHRNNVKEIETELYEAGGYLVDPATLQAEARALEEALQKSAGLVGASANDAATVALDSSKVPIQTRSVADVVGGILNACSELTAIPPATLTDKLTGRLSQYISGMSAQRLTGARFVRTDDLVATNADGGETPFADLDPNSQDIVYVALQLTAAEIYVRNTRMPILVDRAFDVFMPEADALHVRLLQFLANHTQVFLMTERETLASGAHTRSAL